MLVVGVDPSAKKIALVGYEDFTRASVVEQSGKLYPKGTTSMTPAALGNAQLWLESVIMKLEPMAPVGQRFVYVESPIVGRGGVRSTIVQAYVGGVIRACFSAHGFEVIEAHPSKWRSTLGIKGGRGVPTAELKARVLSIIKTSWPKAAVRIGDDTDLSDAAGICLHGITTSGGVRP